LALAGVILVGMSGAVTALGDTLFPSGSLQEGIAQDLSPTAHFLIRLRVLHPILAVVVGLYSAAAALSISAVRPGNGIRWVARALAALVVIQLLVGAVNVALLAPIGMQIIHLLLADLVWIALLLVAASALAQPEAEAVLAEPAVFPVAPEAKAQS
jgi:heme A synthase